MNILQQLVIKDVIMFYCRRRAQYCQMIFSNVRFYIHTEVYMDTYLSMIDILYFCLDSLFINNSLPMY